MTNFIGWLIEKLTGWLAFWNEDKDMGHVDEDYINEAYEERPDMELYDDHYPWSRR